jgi:DNA recombination protein RmuC
MRITRAVEVLRNQLTVTLHDSGGPIEVGALLEQSLQPDEFARDVEIEPGTQERVAIAVRLSDNPTTQVWLPIHVLSAIDGYHELVVATVYDEAERTNDSLKTFERAIIAAAQDLSTKFVCPPHTMNLAILFVAADDLFAEVVRRHALVETLRRDLHVMVAGPDTLPSLVTGLRLVLRGTRPSPRNASNGRVANNSVRSRLDS